VGSKQSGLDANNLLKQLQCRCHMLLCDCRRRCNVPKQDERQLGRRSSSLGRTFQGVANRISSSINSLALTIQLRAVCCQEAQPSLLCNLPVSGRQGLPLDVAGEA
jgi:hypothetical protein